MMNYESLLNCNPRAELARRNFDDFVKYVFENYEMKWFHKYICDKLTSFSRGEIKKLMVFMPPQHGKALPTSTPILTTKGWKSHGSLTKKDYVFGHEGKPKKVISNSGEYEWSLCRITFNDGNSILASPEHLWKLQMEYDDHKGRRELVLETKNIYSKKSRRSPAIDISPALETPQKSLPIDPYVLGCWLGDGHKDLGVLTVGSEDIDHFSKLGEFREVKKNIYRVLIKGLTTKLRSVGLYKKKHIPIDYMLASKEQRLALLQGLMDTDGTVDKRGNCEFTQMDGKFAEDVHILLRTLGIKSRIKNYTAMLNGRDVGVKTRILFNPDCGQQIFRLERKQNRVTNKTSGDRDDKKRFFIKSIENIDNNIVNCIQVEGGMYLAGIDLIPTHNSQLTTRLFPAYSLGKYPNKKIVVASYNATLASRFNRDIQRVIDTQNYHDVFPKTLLNESNIVKVSDSYLRNSEIFEIVGHAGFLKTVGRGGALTGTPVDMGIIDDPIKDRAEAMSETIRESLWSWYQDVFETRLHNDSQQLLIQTRWHEDDLAGKLLKRDDDWEVIVFEAIKEHEYDYDPRSIGDALWPEKHSFERINKVKLTSPLTFNSLYQQNPIPLDDIGIYWDKNILNRYRIFVKPILERTIVSIDPATSVTATSDETGITVQGIDSNGNGYLIEDLSGKYTPNEWATVAVTAVKIHKATCIVAEKNQGGDMVSTIIRQHDPNIRIKLVTASKGKEVRAEPVFGLYEQGKIFHIGEFPILENQMVLFNPKNNDKSPDRVDALVWGFTELMQFKREIHFGW